MSGSATAGGDGEAAEFWEAHHRSLPAEWGTEPNPVTVEVVSALDLRPPPGTRALELGAGHGGDACWLATRGWTVTAVDISATALQRVEELATRAGLGRRVGTERHDVTRSLPEGTFGLVLACYLHLDHGRDEVLRRAWSRLEPGGVLVLVDHASVPPWSWADPDSRFPTAAELLEGLRLDLATPPGRVPHPERLETPSRRALGPDGTEATVSDTICVVRSQVSPA